MMSSYVVSYILAILSITLASVSLHVYPLYNAYPACRYVVSYDEDQFAQLELLDVGQREESGSRLRTMG